MNAAQPHPSPPRLCRCFRDGGRLQVIWARGSSAVRRYPGITAAILFGLVSFAAVATAGTGYAFAPVPSLAEPTMGRVEGGEGALTKKLPDLQADERRLAARLARTEPKGHFIVIDQTHNHLYLRKGNETLLLAVCSAGSGATLAEPGSPRKWVFATPRGRFRVLSKIRNPVWKKPDWAFVEEGVPIPKNPADRFEYGVLGEYALYFGDGYMIHGTLYERLLGRSVTHGCIRLGRDDLRTVYAAVREGTPIYIY